MKRAYDCIHGKAANEFCSACPDMPEAAMLFAQAARQLQRAWDHDLDAQVDYPRYLPDFNQVCLDLENYAEKLADAQVDLTDRLKFEKKVDTSSPPTGTQLVILDDAQVYWLEGDTLITCPIDTRGRILWDECGDVAFDAIEVDAAAECRAIESMLKNLAVAAFYNTHNAPVGE